MRAVLHLDDEPSRLAVGMAVGVFIGISPFYGLHTLLALATAYAFRLNKAATITGTWFNLPWFAPFVYAFCLKLGEVILLGDLSLSWSTVSGLAEAAGAYLRATPREHAGVFLQGLWDMLFSASVALLIGTTVTGAVAGLATYFVTLGAVREVRLLRHGSQGGPEAPDGQPSTGEPRP